MKFTITKTEGNSTLPFTLTWLSTGERTLADYPSMLGLMGEWMQLGFIYVR